MFVAKASFISFNHGRPIKIICTDRPITDSVISFNMLINGYADLVNLVSDSSGELSASELFDESIG